MSWLWNIMSQEPVSNIEYNITNKKCSPKIDQTAPVYITIGDGGNIEGLSIKYLPLP